MTKRSIWLMALLVVGLLVFQVAMVFATDEGGPPAPAGEVNIESEELAEEPIGTQSITTGSSTYDPTTLTKFIPGSAFLAEIQDSTDIAAVSSSCIAPGGASGGSFTEVQAGVELPDGALITGMSFFGQDSNAANITVRLWRTEVNFTLLDPPSLDPLQVAGFTTSGLSGVGSVFHNVDPDELTGNTVGFLGLSSSNRFHWVEVELDNLAGTSHKLCGVEIFYQVPTTGDNQTFTPLSPCAVFDSRPGQGGPGIFNADQTRTVTVTGNTSGQGGEGDCGINTAATSIQLNMLVLSPNGTGTLKLWAAGTSEPNGVLAYNTDSDRWNNSAAVPISAADQISIKTQNSGAHVRLVVTGYYSPVSNMGN